MITFLWALPLILMLVSCFHAYRFSIGVNKRRDFLSSFQRWAFCTSLVTCAGSAVCCFAFSVGTLWPLTPSVWTALAAMSNWPQGTLEATAITAKSASKRCLLCLKLKVFGAYTQTSVGLKPARMVQHDARSPCNPSWALPQKYRLWRCAQRRSSKSGIIFGSTIWSLSQAITLR